MSAVKFLIGLFVVVFSVTLLATFFVEQDKEAEYVHITVEAGETVADIAQKLKDQGVIGSVLAFRWYMKKQGADTAVAAGTFVIPSYASYEAIAQSFTKGLQAKVTIPEGYTIVQIDELLVKMELAERGEFVRCAQQCDVSAFDFLPAHSSRMLFSQVEGYLFPDTYFVDPVSFDVEVFMKRLLGTFEQKVVKGLSDDLRVNGRMLHEIITMASLIERETRTDDERPIVSGILWKRYDVGRGLDVDATVRYVLNKTTGALTKADLEIDSPYNTRRYKGLPPGPISNPGLESIQGALEPKHSDYWYYLHGRDGQIRYGETNEGHNENKARYL